MHRKNWVSAIVFGGQGRGLKEVSSPRRHRHLSGAGAEQQLQREIRFDCFFRGNPANARVADLNFFDTVVGWALKRRLMLGLISSGQWNDNRIGDCREDMGGAALVRPALIDSASNDLALKRPGHSPSLTKASVRR